MSASSKSLSMIVVQVLVALSTFVPGLLVQSFVPIQRVLSKRSSFSRSIRRDIIEHKIHFMSASNYGDEYYSDDQSSSLMRRTDVRNFLTQRSIQSFFFLLSQCRDPHTITWVEVSIVCTYGTMHKYQMNYIVVSRERLHVSSILHILSCLSANLGYRSTGRVPWNWRTQHDEIPDLGFRLCRSRQPTCRDCYRRNQTSGSLSPGLVQQPVPRELEQWRRQCHAIERKSLHGRGM